MKFSVFCTVVVGPAGSTGGNCPDGWFPLAGDAAGPVVSLVSWLDSPTAPFPVPLSTIESVIVPSETVTVLTLLKFVPSVSLYWNVTVPVASPLGVQEAYVPSQPTVPLDGWLTITAESGAVPVVELPVSKLIETAIVGKVPADWSIAVIITGGGAGMVTDKVVDALPLPPVTEFVPVAVSVRLCWPTDRLTNVENWPLETVALPTLLPFSLIATVAPSSRPVTVPLILA